jgi:septum formation protein
VKRLILASSSPRRYELLKATGLLFEVARPDIDETVRPGESAADYVMRLSVEKAWAISSAATDGALILSADTTVVDGTQILGKPADRQEAESMLRQLRNRPHVVHTGVTVLDTETGQSSTRLTTTRVTMRPYSDDEIGAYVDSGDPFGKAGSYAIQNSAFHPVAKLDGCYTNVVGLPLCTVYAMLADYSLRAPSVVPCSPTSPPCIFDPSVSDSKNA